MEKNITTKVMLDRPKAEKLHKEAKQVGETFLALMLQLHDEEGWRALGFESWGHYLEVEWPGTRQNMHRLLTAERVAQNLGHGLPVTHAVALNKLPAEEQDEAYSEAHAAVEAGAPTAAVVEAVVTDRLQRQKQPETLTPKSTPNDKLEAALNYLEKVVGKKEIEAVRKGIIAIPDKEVIGWSQMADDDIRRISELVISHRWMPSAALRFTAKQIDEKTKIADLNLLAVKEPLEVTVSGFTTLTFNRRNFAQELPKLRRILGIKE